ncbi:hypothetical protein LDO26_00970 [Luteimonas sp. BDR2-5]|uniref:hypothetical protein n=1 Tax=Proluteimonas luteida TaxID=2878685 RepID=UPI001E5ED7ED|nr:hypothetical protein [Luteimonas sp. BDR2-5]MCD9026787.1 hypothetical protein [Luteimonas sp. BDR2-5]
MALRVDECLRPLEGIGLSALSSWLNPCASVGRFEQAGDAMHRWEIRVFAGSDYISFADHFRCAHVSFGSDHDEHTGHVFSAYSYHIDHLDDPVAISNRIYSFELLVNGARRLSAGGLESTMRIEFDGYHAVDGGEGRYKVVAIDEDPFDSPGPPPVGEVGQTRAFTAARYIDVAASDSTVRTLLFLAGIIYNNSPKDVILTWGTLYKLYDTYRHMAKELGAVLADFEDAPGETGRFTAACNNMSVLGLGARHGLSANQPPSNPMTGIDDAIETNLRIARKISERYIEARHSAP